MRSVAWKSRYGPLWPNGLICTITSAGFTANNDSSARPSAASLPGGSDSKRKSETAARRSSSSRPRAASRSSVTPRLPALAKIHDRLRCGCGVFWKKGPCARAGSPPGCSILITSAPRPASTRPPSAPSAPVRSSARNGVSAAGVSLIARSPGGRQRPMYAACSFDDAPLHEREVFVRVVLEHGLDRAADLDLLHRVAEQVADHAHVVRVRQLDQHDEIGAGFSEGGVHRVPDALPAEDAATPRDALPAQIEGAAAVADELRSPLEAVAGVAALHQQLMPVGSLPVRRVQPVGRRPRRRQPRRQIRFPNRVRGHEYFLMSPELIAHHRATSRARRRKGRISRAPTVVR